MHRSDMKNRLYLSGMDDHAFEKAAEHGLGYECAAFCWAPLMQDEALLQRERERAGSMERCVFHAPFAELEPCAIDPLIREVTLRRYRESVALALSLGIRRIVIHDGFIPRVYYPEWFTEQSVLFWREFLQELPQDVTLLLENVMDGTPELLRSVMEGVADPRLAVCLDIGHAACHKGAVPVEQWVKSLAPWLRHSHIHNNHGAEDMHLSLPEGIIPMEQVLDAMLDTPCTFTIENQNCVASLLWLREKGYLPQ